MDILKLKAWEMKEHLLKKDISSREIVMAHLDKIEKTDDRINAFISVDKDNALRRADEIDKKIKNNEELGSLAGIPVGIKDNIVTKNLRTTAASKMLEDFLPPYDATAVKKIRENDGIILGKTNMDEFAMGGSSQSSYFSGTKNPLDESRIPGGSSGGSAAAIAGGQLPLALGTDTGGSIRLPAAYCNIVGIKPSYGLVSRYGLISLSNSLDQIGVFAGDVKDAVILLNTISGYDDLDNTSVDIDASLDLQSLESPKSFKGTKIGLPKEIFSLDMDTRVREEMDKAINLLEAAGAQLIELSIAKLKYSPEIYKILVYGDISSNMARFDGIRYGYRAEDYDTLDDLYIKTRTEALGEEVKKRMLLGTYLLSGNRGEDYYKKAQKARTLLIQDFNKAFSKVDIILSPSSTNLPRRIDQPGASKYKSYNEAVNLAGLCSISLPTRADKGSFVGLQLIGDRFKEESIIRAALAYEGMVK